MFKSLTHNLARLVTFQGRDTRDQFWPYAVAIFVLMTGVLFASMSVRMVPLMAEIHQFALAHPDQSTITTGPGSYQVTIEGDHAELTQSFLSTIRSMIAVTAWTCVGAVLLYAAAVTRRLHDRGAGGWWGLLPLPFMTFAMIAMPKLFAAMDRPEAVNLKLFFLMFFNNVAYMGALAILVVMLAKRSDLGPNRFGS